MSEFGMNHMDELLSTLDICRKSLPPETHTNHFERLEEIERIIRNQFHTVEAYKHKRD